MTATPQKAPPFSRKKPSPLYQQIATHLRERIVSGEFPPGEKLPSIRSLAKDLSVNHLTLRQALRRLDQEGIVTTEFARGTYVVGTQKTKLQIALILPNLNEASSRLSAGVGQQLADTQSTIDIFHYADNPANENQNLLRLANERYDGAILYPSLHPDTMRSVMKLIVDAYPLVFIARAPTTLPCTSVLADNISGGDLATQHLIDRGCKRVACEYSTLPGAEERFQGYLAAMGRNGLPIDYALVQKYTYADDQIEHVVNRWLDMPQPPDGIVFANDFQALRGLRQINARGLKVPDNIRITGFDDLSLAQVSTPPLTTIRQDYFAIGQTAAELLQKQISQHREKRLAPNHRLISVDIVQRQSS